MPAANQGSRGTLIAWTVLTSIVSVVALVMAIYFYIDSNRANEVATTRLNQVQEVITPAILASQGEKVEGLREALKDETRGLNSSMKLFDVALAQRDALARLISGTDNEPAALTSAKAALEKAKAAAGGTPDSLVAAINSLTTRLEALQSEAAASKADSEESRKKMEQAIADTKAQIDSLTKAMEELRSQKDSTIEQTTRTATAQQESFGQTADELRKQYEGSQEQINALNAQNATLGTQVNELQTRLKVLQETLGANRTNVASMMTRQVDGKLVRVSAKTVVIDLGAGDHISPGLTFEVYDKFDGVPAAGDPSTDTGLPVGKASIEVIRVLSTGSECQITRQAFGQALVEGDLIVNLVYDRNTKFNFVVYGNFDMDNNGVATPGDAEVIKRLINGWGGNVVDKINVNTDFVILGREPAIPEKPSVDDALQMKIYEDAVAALDEYTTIAANARDYRLPILNQNRFLVLVGYYHMAKR
jgi:hypothetical protein